ncbi:PREDICTED: uncharacterized protein LOC108663716 [Theobroma cacao]|uniref:Uncharacterized protein LOC108663716 n=1 Tax=Theobroma cacao TaxID=3641 RepID=A0AB32WZ08_THECC|nr:PREDICTED: uncharacterized protein LOC108663716 [Theobroma cacao]
MATIPAIALAVQYAAGVPLSGCQQLRRNLVTKTHHKTIMAAKSNPAVRYETGVLVSTPCQLLDRNRESSKRVKTIMAAYPIQFATDVPESTDCNLRNFSGGELKLDDKTFWEGLDMNAKDLPRQILDKGTPKFKHDAFGGSVIGSSGGLEYVFGGGEYKWIIAWSNSKNELNKVYTKIFKGDVVGWNEIRESLAKSDDESSCNEFGYSSDVVIDQTSSTPIMTATLSKANPETEAPAEPTTVEPPAEPTTVEPPAEPTTVEPSAP